jgi:hypothetical protein
VITAVLVLAVETAAVRVQPVSGTSPAGLFYEVSGSGEPLVLIHAFSLDRRIEQRLSPPAIKRLSEIQCSVLVIVGDQDLAHIKEIADLIVQGVARGKRVTIPGAGHIVNLDAPEAFNEALEAFLGK